MNESIYESVKKLIGIGCSEDFDQDLIIHINTVLFILNQAGIVNDDYAIGSDSLDKTWADILREDQVDLHAIVTYVALKVRMIFDPPTSGTLADAIKNNLAELEWRLYITENYVGEI